MTAFLYSVWGMWVTTKMKGGETVVRRSVLFFRLFFFFFFFRVSFHLLILPFCLAGHKVVKLTQLKKKTKKKKKKKTGMSSVG